MRVFLIILLISGLTACSGFGTKHPKWTEAQKTCYIKGDCQ